LIIYLAFENRRGLFVSQNIIGTIHHSEDLNSELGGTIHQYSLFNYLDFDNVEPAIQPNNLSLIFTPSITQKNKLFKDLRKFSSNNAIECVICLGNLKDFKNRMYLQWAHIYHKKWMRKWIKSHQTWPVCRSTVKIYPTNNNSYSL
jgi:hypothetical protein